VITYICIIVFISQYLKCVKLIVNGNYRSAQTGNPEAGPGQAYNIIYTGMAGLSKETYRPVGHTTKEIT